MSITLNYIPEDFNDYAPDCEDDRETKIALNVYGSITPQELVLASKSRTPTPSARSRWREYLDLWDAGGGIREAMSPEIVQYDTLIGLTMHRNARLVSSPEYPLESLKHRPRHDYRVSWVQEEDHFEAPWLNLKHMTLSNETKETVQGCVWLMRGEREYHRGDHGPVNVRCKLQIVEHLLETVRDRRILEVGSTSDPLRTQYRTQHPIQFFIRLCDDDIHSTDFIATINRITALLSSMPERTKLVSPKPGAFPFLETILNDPVLHESIPFKHRATFTLHVEDTATPPRWSFTANVDACDDPRGSPTARRTPFERSRVL